MGRRYCLASTQECTFLCVYCRWWSPSDISCIFERSSRGKKIIMKSCLALERFTIFKILIAYSRVEFDHMQSCESKFMKDSKGLINRIMFTPWDDPCFITGGCDHAVVLWREQYKNNEWKSTLLHKDLHSSAVMGVAGMRHNNLVLSCGDDRRFVGYDAREEKLTFRHRLDNRCTSLLPNPRDVNLVMVHTRWRKQTLDSYSSKKMP